jgi:hypothetical protein
VLSAGRDGYFILLHSILEQIYGETLVPDEIEGFLVPYGLSDCIIQIIPAMVADLEFPDMEDGPIWIQFLDFTLAHIAFEYLHTATPRKFLSITLFYSIHFPLSSRIQ